MCDSIGIDPVFTGSGASIFGKNSDREPDETQLVLSIPRESYSEGEHLQCTYITIPQVLSTHALVVCKPFWIWGAEMGVNEKGVVIGNEALFTKIRPEKRPGLTGMDLLRLALERANTAQEASEVIIDLLSRYGQAGPCGYRDKKFSYMNSFLIMDRGTMLVLETIGRDFAIKSHSGFAVISNGITLSSNWDSSSLPAGTDMSVFTDRLTTYFAGSAFRRGQNQTFCEEGKGRISITNVFGALKGHYGHAPSLGFNRDVCMHAMDPLIRRSQTTGSMVVELCLGDRMRIFVTAGSAPCLTAFKPFLPAAPFDDAGRGGDRYAEDSYWWRHEAMYINAMFRYDNIMPFVQTCVNDLEQRWSKTFPAHLWGSEESALIEDSHSAFNISEEMDRQMIGLMRDMKRPAFSLSNLYWGRIARRTGVPII